MFFKSSVSKHFFLKKNFLSIYTVVLPSNLTNEYFDIFYGNYVCKVRKFKKYFWVSMQKVGTHTKTLSLSVVFTWHLDRHVHTGEKTHA